MTAQNDRKYLEDLRESILRDIDINKQRRFLDNINKMIFEDDGEAKEFDRIVDAIPSDAEIFSQWRRAVAEISQLSFHGGNIGRVIEVCTWLEGSILEFERRQSAGEG